MTLEPPKLTTFQELRASSAAHAFADAELRELVEPKYGIITGYATLMAQLETLRRIDLGATPPAQGVPVQGGDP
ncbi:hypothetical protein [Roseovarius salinarum]|uniref:hypothetical protein n=1 Tax=Roseovarius salinarum TaxID=1981892 RepID=UPI000C34A1E6|nr:hypothetical protein [Roseovarius salinarum]